MASDIILVRNVPEAPTKVPPTIRTGFPRTNPSPATARPVKALSMEITTGMSAPPIGSTKATPRASASRSSRPRPAAPMPPTTTRTPRITMAAATAPFRGCCPG